MSKMMRISDETAEKLNYLSENTGKTKLEIMEEAIELLAKKKFFKELNDGYKKLSKNQEYLDEIEEWDQTLLDGLEDD